MQLISRETKLSPAPPISRVPSRRLSDDGRSRLLSMRGEPLFLAAWERVLFLHYEVDPDLLQKELPFPLDLWNGKAFVSLVAFTMRGMRPRIGGYFGALIFKPIATHFFLNVRTYVRCGDERGICFLTEWLSNRLSVMLGPPVYGLPYRYAKINYENSHEAGGLNGRVKAPNGKQFGYDAQLVKNSFESCPIGSFDEFMLERYTAFNWRGRARRFFRIWHPSWRQAQARVSIMDDSLPAKTFSWFKSAKFIGANYSPGFDEVWMGRAHSC